MNIIKKNSDLSHLHIPEKYLCADTIIPRTVIIESVFGCNASCTMCPIDMPTNRQKGIIDPQLYRNIIDQLTPYKDEIEQLDIFGVGEPLLDKNYPAKIAYAKSKGFKNVGFATNADLLTADTANAVLNAGVDTIMISIDGVKKETHESIRRKTTFENVVNNTLQAIEFRNKTGAATKFVLRFIRQKQNISEWDDFLEFWGSKIDEKCGDLIAGYDLHSWGGEIDVEDGNHAPSVPDDLPCHHLYDRMIILKDGSVSLCCADMHLCNYKIGDCNENDPISIYNSDKMNKIRQLHLDGKRANVKICKACTILDSESVKFKSCDN